MVDNEKLYKLYDAMMKVELITTKDIKELGFTQSDITKMVDDGTLVRVQRGYYNFGSIDSLFMYGKSLVDSNKREEGLEVFRRCSAIDSNNVNVALQLMLSSIKSKSYGEILTYYDVLYNSDSTNKRYLYYLLLLSYIIELPEHYKFIVKSTTPEELMVEENDAYTRLLNNTISLVYNGKLPFAYSKRAGYHSKHEQSVNDYAEITILKEAVAVNAVRKKKIETCILEERYDEAIELLGQEASVREIPIYNKYVSVLLNDLVRMINFKEVHEVEKVSYLTGNLFVAIDNYDYELAMRLSEQHNKANNMENNQSLIYVLLDRIIKLKNQILEVGELVEVVSKEEAAPDEVLEAEAEEVVDNTVTYSQLVSHLLLGDVDKFGLELGGYLTKLDEVAYYSFLTNLVEICRLKNCGYNKVCVILAQLSNGTYKYDDEEYLGLFYESIANKEYDIATLYLIMIESVSFLSDEMIGELNKVVKTLKEKAPLIEETVLVEGLDDSQLEGQLDFDEISTIGDSGIQVEESVAEVIPPTRQERDEQAHKEAGFVPIAKTKPFRDVSVSDEYRRDEEFIALKIEELKSSRGLITLRPMDEKRRKRIHDIVSRRKELTSFSIGSGENRRIILRFIGNVYIPLKETIKIADDAYYKRDYQTALTAYLDILGTNNPRTYIYAKVGLTYMKMWKIEKAIEYLTVATELSRINKENFDFSDLIGSLDGTIAEHEKKPKVNMKLSEFIEDDANFGVDRIDEMLEYKELNNLSYEEACEQLGFTYEEYLLALLVLVKRNYEDVQYEAGDKLLKVVEKSGNKSKRVIAKMNEVRRNKKFYKNRGKSIVMKSSE